MAASLGGVFSDELSENIENSKILVVGAGGIGCELLKNLVLTGFKDIDVIDLDTIDVSNLNRQFLFQKQHVGKSKAKVAQETAQSFNPDAKIRAHHDSVMSPDYDLDYFKQYTMVLNALDNRAARNHVNRMCLAADIPLIESGTAGYFGQVTLIKKGLTECYECRPKTAEKTYPGCTIRNTPSEPIHCIVWSKHLFNQLFGEADADEDVSPDTADPEAAGELAGEQALQTEANNVGNVERVSTRAWAISEKYNPESLFKKLFYTDIQYLLSMDKLWQKRRPPTPLQMNQLPDVVAGCSTAPDEVGIKDQRIWSIRECGEVFSRCVASLSKKLEMIGENDHLVWDKDDEDAMDFVTACANIRCHIFGIATKSRFDIKSMAGNIIPAIATTNAIIAGVIVLHALKILMGRLQDCQMTYLKTKPNYKNRLLVPSGLDKPNPKCYVCSPKPEVIIRINTETATMKMLEDKVLKSGLNMIAPDVEIDGSACIVISSEEGETTGNQNKTLKEMNIRQGTRLKCDDFLQNYELVVNIVHCDSLKDNQEFEIIGDMSLLQAKPEDEQPTVSNGSGDPADAPGPSRVDDDDDLLIVETEEELDTQVKPASAIKRKADNESGAPKRAKFSDSFDDDDDITLVE